MNAEEKEGFRRAAEDEKLKVLDLVTVRRSGTRVLRAGDSPIVRGTAMLFDGKSGIVYLKGTVPYFQVHPGAYIPLYLVRSSLSERTERRAPPNSRANLSGYPSSISTIPSSTLGTLLLCALRGALATF